MATLTVSSGDYIRPRSSTGRIVHFGEGAGQTFKKGAPVIADATADRGDQIDEAGADPSAIYGFAAEDASGTEATKLPVYMADDDAEFIVRVADGQALDRDDVSAAGFGIVYDSTYLIWRLDRTETSAKVFKVTRLIDAHGDVNGRVRARVLQAARLWL